VNVSVACRFPFINATAVALPNNALSDCAHSTMEPTTAPPRVRPSWRRKRTAAGSEQKPHLKGVVPEPREPLQRRQSIDLDASHVGAGAPSQWQAKVGGSTSVLRFKSSSVNE
jgi:hypothetical protein